jgi:hypothetical protein
MYNVIDGSNNMFGFAILLGCVRARKAKMNTLLKGERAGCIIVEFTTIITLNKLNTIVEVSKNIAMEIAQGTEHVRFKGERESPQIVSKIIQTHEIIFRSRYAHNRRCPQITMNQLEWFSGAEQGVGER